MVEGHGVPDTDDILGNEVNDNITIIYTDHVGNYVGSCIGAPCGSIPSNTQGLEVFVREEFPTFFAGVIGIEEVNVGANAIAVIVAGYSDLFSEGMALLAFAENCSPDDKPIDVSGQNEEILGATHSNSYIHVSGSTNHFHGQVSSVGGTVDTGQDNLYEPENPEIVTDTLNIPDALFNISVSDFISGGAQVLNVPPEHYHDLSGIGSQIDTGILESEGLYNPDTGELATGVYYVGTDGFQFDLSDSDMHGQVSLISSGEIVLGGSAIRLNNYLENGILFFTDYQPPTEPCKNRAISIAGSSNVIDTYVDHTPPCPDSDPDTGCWTASDNLFKGLIYASRGKVETNGDNSTYYGGILAYTIKLNGTNELFVGNPFLFPPTTPLIMLFE